MPSSKTSRKREAVDCETCTTVNTTNNTSCITNETVTAKKARKRAITSKKIRNLPFTNHNLTSSVEISKNIEPSINSFLNHSFECLSPLPTPLLVSLPTNKSSQLKHRKTKKLTTYESTKELKSSIESTASLTPFSKQLFGKSLIECTCPKRLSKKKFILKELFIYYLFKELQSYEISLNKILINV